MTLSFGDHASCLFRVDDAKVFVDETHTRWLYGAFSTDFGGVILGDSSAEETLNAVAGSLDFQMIYAAFIASRDVGMSAYDAASAYQRMDGAVYESVLAEPGDEDLSVLFARCHVLSAIDSFPKWYVVPGSNLERFVWDDHGTVREAHVAAGAFVSACEQFIDYVQRLTAAADPPSP